MAKGDFIESIVQEARRGRAPEGCDCLNCRLADALEECAAVVAEKEDQIRKCAEYSARLRDVIAAERSAHTATKERLAASFSQDEIPQ